MNRLFLTTLFCVGIIVGLLFSTELRADAVGSGHRLHILATFAPYYCFAKNVAGDSAEVAQLLPPGAEPHDFSLAPSDLKKLADSDLIIENGLGIESWLEGVVQGGKAKVVVASDGIASEEGNPHVWLDPLLAIQLVENIRKAMAAGDPAHASVFNANAAAYTEKLKQLDSEIRAVTDKLTNKRLVPFHDAFHYFAKRYGFEVVGVFEEFPGRMPGPRYLQNLRDEIVKKNVTVLFTEPLQSPEMLRSLSEDLKLPIVEIDPMEQSEPSADLYEKTMRSNLKNLQEALRGK